ERVDEYKAIIAGAPGWEEKLDRVDLVCVGSGEPLVQRLLERPQTWRKIERKSVRFTTATADLWATGAAMDATTLWALASRCCVLEPMSGDVRAPTGHSLATFFERIR